MMGAASYSDISYGPHERNILDLYLAASEVATPLYVYIHGGGFQENPWHGKLDIPLPFLEHCLEEGISVASISYRLSDTHPYPAPMQDGARAIQFLRHRAREYNLDPKRIAAGGPSAGAGITFWIAFQRDLGDPHSTDPIDRQSTRLACITTWQAQSSYDPNFIRQIVSGPAYVHPAVLQLFRVTPAEFSLPRVQEMFKEASALNNVSADAPPVFLWYTTPDLPMTEDLNSNDGIHHPIFGKLLKEKMDTLGVECVARYREDLPDLPQEDVEARYHLEQVAFLRQHLRVSAKREGKHS